MDRWRLIGEICSVLICLICLRCQLPRNLELWLTERHIFLSSSVHLSLLQAPFDLTSISPSLFSPHTLLNSLLSGIQGCLTELARCPHQIKHFSQEKIVSSLLPFQLWVFVLLTTNRQQTQQTTEVCHSFCAKVTEALQLPADAQYYYSHRLFIFTVFIQPSRLPSKTHDGLVGREEMVRQGWSTVCVCFFTHYSLTTP